jgi:hypothetical protein
MTNIEELDNAKDKQDELIRQQELLKNSINRFHPITPNHLPFLSNFVTIKE